MKPFRALFYLVIVLAALFILFVAYGMISDYRPPERIVLDVNHNVRLLQDSVFNLVIWNIGYGGLGDNMDFFYDGGQGVRSSRERVGENLEGILEFAGRMDSADLLLFQEVDLDSRRSYHIDQFSALKEEFPGYHASLGVNYDVFFVPLPLRNPYGSVTSGIATLSRYTPVVSARYQFPGNYAWPMGVFMLDRCFLVNRYRLAGGNELLVVNTHNSAYDDGTLKQGQMEYLHGFLTGEYAKGNHIVVGGDWNQTPAGFQPAFSGNIFDTVQLNYIGKNYLPANWTWLYDPGVPTNRRVDMPYDPGRSRTTVIDFYLLSPNLEALEVKGIDLDFRHSDHQPVLAKIRIE